MPVPLNHLKGSAGRIFPVGFVPWHLTEFLESDLNFLSDRRSISRRREREGKFGHCVDGKRRGNKRKVEGVWKVWDGRGRSLSSRTAYSSQRAGIEKCETESKGREVCQEKMWERVPFSAAIPQLLKFSL